MHKYFKDYRWKNGSPYGVEVISEAGIMNNRCYKIVSDPYHKRYSIEKYLSGNFVSVVYDSHMLDFRNLKVADQTAWQKTTLSESEKELKCLIRNQDDRIIFIEHSFFEDNLCRSCQILSPQGNHLSTHKMFYKSFKDSFDGVALYDPNAHIVMFKIYDADPISGDFTVLKKEEWHIKNNSDCVSLV